MAPEIIPPMTRVVTYTKSSKPVKSKSGHLAAAGSSVNDDTSVVQSRGWTGGEFTPAVSRALAMQAPSAAANISTNRTKRYSSQRQRNLPESGMTDISSQDASASATSVANSKHVVSVTSVLPLQSRPIPAAAFYGKFVFMACLDFQFLSS
jgi:hypothetical protein